MGSQCKMVIKTSSAGRQRRCVLWLQRRRRPTLELSDAKSIILFGCKVSSHFWVRSKESIRLVVLDFGVRCRLVVARCPMANDDVHLGRIATVLCWPDTQTASPFSTPLLSADNNDNYCLRCGQHWPIGQDDRCATPPEGLHTPVGYIWPKWIDLNLYSPLDNDSFLWLEEKDTRMKCLQVY